jgi:hypothetical protein
VSIQTVSRYLVEHLRAIKHIRAVKVMDAGALLVTVSHVRFHEDIMIYVLAGELSTGFIKKTLNANTHADRHTLYIVALDLITEDHHTALMSDGLRLMLQAFGGKVYVYSEQGGEVRIFPVLITPNGHIQAEDPVNLADLSGDYATFDNKYILGVRKVAGFMRQEFHIPQPTADESLYACFELLGIEPGANLTDIKRAYRRKARTYHPDTNQSPGATEQMQAINEAYARILERYVDA